MFGSDGSPIVQYVSIFAVIFAVLTVIVLLVRRLAGRGLTLPGRAGQRGRQPRLGIVDVYELDRQRQLILLRRDNVEHLLLVGGPNDVVIERNIQRGQRALNEPVLRAEAMAEPVHDPAPEALPNPVPASLPEPAEALLPGRDARRPEPAIEPRFEMPVVVPAAVPGSRAAPPVTHPLDAAALGPEEEAQPSGLTPDPVVPGPRPDGQAKRTLRWTAPPLVNPRPDVASERGRTEEPAPSPAPPVAAPAERRAIDPAILSDMARQLQAALGRPSSAVTPPPPPPPPATPAPDPQEVRVEAAAPPPSPAVDPVAAAMAATPPVEPAAPRSAEATDAGRKDGAPARPAPEPFLPPPPPVAEPPPTLVQAPPVPQPAPPVPARPKPEAAPNPFSVEEIEAEFARLLGRPLDRRN